MATVGVVALDFITDAFMRLGPTRSTSLEAPSDTAAQTITIAVDSVSVSTEAVPNIAAALPAVETVPAVNPAPALPEINNTNTNTTATNTVVDVVHNPLVACTLCGEQQEIGDFVLVGEQSQVEQWFKSSLCTHEACRTCLQKWIKVNVAEGKVFIRCPMPDCDFRMYADDIQRLALTEDHEAYVANVNAIYDRRQAELAEGEGAEFKEYVDKNTKSCPACHVIIERYEGCNYMVCTCGCEFCYVCGDYYSLCGGQCD